MRVCQAIVVVAVAFLANTASLSAEEARHVKMPPQAANALVTGQERKLRVDAVVHANDEEERGWGDLPSLKSIVRNILSRKGAKAQQPILIDTPEDVLKIETLQSLSRKIRKPHKNYKLDEILVDANVLERWVGNGVSSFDAWKRLGLLKVRESKLDKVADTKNFADYLAFVKILDDAGVAKWKRTGMGPNVSPEPTAAELTARALALGINKREDEYAKFVLGLEGLSGNALKQHTNYRFYEDFKIAKDPSL